jgi:hypothetical protein
VRPLENRLPSAGCLRFSDDEGIPLLEDVNHGPHTRHETDTAAREEDVGSASPEPSSEHFGTVDCTSNCVDQR